MKRPKIIFQIEGGLGKNIAATAVCKAIKTQYPDSELVVMTGYPAVFLCNPYADTVLDYNSLHYFYRDHIMGQDVKTFLFNPYLATDFINLKGHLIQVWCEIFGVKYNGELPELFLTERELRYYSNLLGSDKPILTMHTNGGPQNQKMKYSWTRDLPIDTAQRIANAFANDYTVVHICRKDQLQLQNVTPLETDIRALFVLLEISAKRLLIDSFAQHAAAALNLPSFVCWIGNLPSQFGYQIHTNIVANPPTIRPELRGAVFGRYDIQGQPIEFPYKSEREIFDAEEIIAILKGTKANEIKISGEQALTNEAARKKNVKQVAAEQ